MRCGETDAHRGLKRLAFAWARNAGLPVIGCEVRVPKSPDRADVAAVSRHLMTAEAVVALFECKQCRANFLKNQADEPSTRRTAEFGREKPHRRKTGRGNARGVDESADFDGSIIEQRV